MVPKIYDFSYLFSFNGWAESSDKKLMQFSFLN